MDSAVSEDLLKLEIFKCKFCKHRLQYPVMQVETFGNICGSCYDKSVYTNVTRNTDVETILSKMYVECKFVKSGCGFEEYFISTCDHEEECFYRERICPFSYKEECDNIPFPDIIGHISEKHVDYILTVESNSVLIKNPVIPNCNMFYLLKANSTCYFLHMKFNEDEQVFLYALYYFENENYKRGNISFLITAESEIVNVKTKSGFALHESNFKLLFDETCCLKVKSPIFTCLEANENVKLIIVNENEDCERVSNGFADNDFIDWFKCSACADHVLKEIYICFSCRSKTCSNCIINDACSKCRSYISKNLFNYNKLTSNVMFPCKNTGCKKYIVGNEYELHRTNCAFKQYECVFSDAEEDCKWVGVHKALFEHMGTVHGFEIGKYTSVIQSNDNSYFYAYILKYKTVFKLEYSLENNNFTFKIGVYGATYSSGLYLWEVHIEKLNSPCVMIISDSCLHFDEIEDKTINVQEYLHNNELSFSIFIKNKTRSYE